MNTCRTTLLTLCSALLFAAGCGGSGLTNRNGGDGIVFASAQNGMVIAPGADAPITVRLSDANGRPLSGRRVRVVGPAGVARGEGAEGHQMFEGSTDGSGTFSATLTGLPDGSTLVSVTDLGTGEEGTVAVTVTAMAPPPLSGAEATEAVRNKFGKNGSRVHGPALLGPDDRVHVYAHGGTAPPPALRGGSGASWLFWVDDMPGARFAHPTRIVVLDATDNAAGFVDRAQVQQAQYYPGIESAGVVRAMVPADWNYGDEVGFGKTVARRGGVPYDPAEVGAVIVTGPDCEGSRLDAIAMRNFLRDSGRVPESNMRAEFRPVSPGLTKLMIEDIKSRGYKKVYFYYSGHGEKLGMVMEGRDGNTELMYYDHLARALQGVAEVCVMIDACHSAAAIEPFQNLGLTGEIVTAANDDKLAFSTYNNDSEWQDGVYTREFLKCIQDSRADRNGDGFVSFREAAAWCKQHSEDETMLASDPVAAGIGQTDATPWPTVPSVGIVQVGLTATVNIPRPSGLPNGPYLEATITVANTSIATLQGTANVMFLGNTASLPVTFVGVAQGATTYTISGRAGTGERFEATGTITVGSQLQFSQTTIDISVGATATVQLNRTGAVVGGASSVVLGSTDNGIAQPNPASIVFEPNVTSRNVMIIGQNIGVALIAAIDNHNDLRAEITVRVHQEVTLDYDLVLGGIKRFSKGDRIRSDRITGYTIWGPHPPFCDYWHMHAATPAGIMIDGLGPFPDPGQNGCGYGHVIAPSGGHH